MLPAKRPVLLALLAVLAVLAYLPTLRQPLLEDDYPNLAQAQVYGAPGAWQQLAGSVFRLRATSEWLMNAAWNSFGLNPAPYYAVSIALHILNTWLVYALGAWTPVGYRVSGWAALFFAVYEGHQEAVMWFSACNELLQFLCGAGAIVCWLHFLRTGKARWYAAMLAGLGLALISKESAAVIAALLCVLTAWSDAPRRWVALGPAVVLAVAAAISVYVSRDNSFRFQDGSFSLHAPFWRILPENFARLFWSWGWLAVLAAWQRNRRLVLLGALWAAIGLLPYSFLTYSARIPSRQLYLASAGLALVAGAAMEAMERRKQALAALVCAAVLLHNIGYLWTRKRSQFLERAEPTEQLIAFGRRNPGPIFVECFPRPGLIAQDALRLGAGKQENDVIWDAETARVRGAAAFCYTPAAAR